jgi:hypothetical protein
LPNGFDLQYGPVGRRARARQGGWAQAKSGETMITKPSRGGVLFAPEGSGPNGILTLYICLRRPDLQNVRSGLQNRQKSP